MHLLFLVARLLPSGAIRLLPFVHPLNIFTPAPAGPDPLCNSSYSELDKWRPLDQVVAEHPEGGHCYFGQLDSWFSQCGWAITHRDFSKFGDFIRTRKGAPDWLRDISPDSMNRTIRYWGGKFVTNDYKYLFGQFYCHANGWTRLPRNLVNNYTAWSHLARMKCAELTAKVPGYQKTSVSYMQRVSMLQGDLGIFMPILPNGRLVFYGIVDPWTKEQMEEHAAWKCALDPEIGVGCDMAHCSNNICDLGDDHLAWAGPDKPCP